MVNLVYKRKLDSLLKDFVNDDVREVCVDLVFECHHPYEIIVLLEEYLCELRWEIMNSDNLYRCACINRDLKRYGSPITLDLNYSLSDFVRWGVWEKWSVWDIEREYLYVLLCRGEGSDFAPSDRFLKGEVFEMLRVLVDCDVIYGFKKEDLFVNSVEGELDSYFRSFKRIRVQCL